MAAVLSLALGSIAARAEVLGPVAPLAYELTLDPRPEVGTFSGSATIALELHRPRATLRLQAEGLSVKEAFVQADQVRQRASLSVEDGAIVLHLRHPAPAGRILVELAWTGALSTQGRGLYVTNLNGHRYVLTQLEPDGAHAVFPCLDAPAMRARFHVRAVVADEDMVIGNGAIVDEQPGPRAGTKLVELAETPPISPHLVALAIGRFELRTAHAGLTPITIAAAPGHRAEAEAALATAADLLPRVEEFLGVPYPFGKLDLVAAPGLAPRGMENAAAIFVRADELLVDPSAPLPRRQAVARLLTHELAHQWFGDLVAVSSWRDLWLAEGLARWLEFELLDEMHPDWKVWSWFQPMRDRMLAADALHSTHALSEDAPARPSFDVVTYDKGAATLRMLQRWMGGERLRLALQRYVRAGAFGVAHTRDLWRALGTVADASTVELARSWTEQRGYPEITVSAHCVGDTLDLGIAQRPAGRYDRRAHARWEIPIELRADAMPVHLLLRTETAHVHLHDPAGCPTKIDPTDEETTPFRVHVNRAPVALQSSVSVRKNVSSFSSISPEASPSRR